MHKPSIAFDLMGSDKGYQEMVAGVELAIARGVGAEILLVGIPEAIGYATGRLTLIKAGISLMPSSNSAELRSRDSSVAICANRVREAGWDAMFSCGNTQLAVAWATMDRGIGMFPGFTRPPLALVVPNQQVGQTVLLDAGSNVDCPPELLVEFAKLGSAFVRVALNVNKPTIRLLANGTEDYKGNKQIQSASRLLAGLPGYSGLTEGNRILTGDSHVIVADGLLGNVAFKLMEGTGGYIITEMKAAFGTNLLTKLVGLLVRPILRPIKDKFNPSKYGSMPLLGTNGLVMIGHGAADAEAVAAGIEAAVRYVEMGLVGKMAGILMPKPVK